MIICRESLSRVVSSAFFLKEVESSLRCTLFVG